MMGIIRSILAILSISIVNKNLIFSNGSSIERKIQILNQSGHRVEVYWIHPQTQEMVLQSSPHVFNGASLELNSFVGHTFQAIEMPGSRSGVCKEDTCKTTFFTVNENEDQVFFLERNMVLKQQDNKSIARDGASDLIDTCRLNALNNLGSDPESAAESINQLVECVENSVAEKLEEANEEIAFQANIRTKMGDLLENYTCADFDLNTTEPMETKYWAHKNQKVTVKVMHERPHSKIHLLENFINPDECKAMEEAAKSTLHPATVANEDGGSRLSENRKAMQAGIKVPWHKELFGNPIAVLSRRVFDYTNHATNFDLKEFGQEDLMSIQYFGRGEDDEAPDRYMPHCDGDCAGLRHKTGTRVATMVMYCDIPEKGGSTNFRNAGIHINPKPGAAVFFSYMGSDGFMDKGFTEHSGCPVLIGEKKIVTQWMRKGVDTKNPWDSFNTLGVKISDSD